MRSLISPMLGLCLVIGLIAPASAQPPARQPGSDQRARTSGQNAEGLPTATPAPPAAESDARAIREQLRELMQRYPPEVGRILTMDPTLLQNETYLAQYPALSSFLTTHTQVAHNPDYYFDFVRFSYDYTEPADPANRMFALWRELVETMVILSIMAFVAAVLIWLIRTVLDHRRWLRVSRVQTEVHHKLLDRFAGTNELLAYVQTPAGRRFLEAAPIPLDATPAGPPAPLNRILWSFQIGVVLAVVGLGFQFVTGRVTQEVAEGLWVLGVLAIAFGVGFVLSGVVSYFLSRRLGLLSGLPLTSAERSDPPI